MAALDLSINPSLIVAQAGLFLVGVTIVKKLMLDPYLELRASRESSTSGESELAANALRSCEEKEREIAKRIAVAISQAKAAKDKEKEEGLRQQRLLVDQCSVEVKAIAKKTKADISKELVKQRERIPQLVSELSQKVLASIT